MGALSIRGGGPSAGLPEAHKAIHHNDTGWDRWEDDHVAAEGFVQESETLGTWSAVKSQSGSFSRSELLLKCYTCNTTLTDCVFSHTDSIVLLSHCTRRTPKKSRRLMYWTHFMNAVHAFYS